MMDVVGWGATQSGGNGNPVLLEVEVSVADNGDCNENLGGITENMICTKIEEGKAICNVIYSSKT